MMNNVVNMARPAPAGGPIGARLVDHGRGGHSGVLSSQWFSRPDDQRFLSLDDLYQAVKSRSERSWVDSTETKTVKVIADREVPEVLRLGLADGREVHPSHWSFGQLCSAVGAPPSYLRRLPAFIAAIPLQYGLMNNPAELVKLYATDMPDGSSTVLRAVTSPSYGRIYDHQVIEALLRVVDPTWKVPGVMDWGSGIYDPNVEVSKRSTTLYASDRDVFVFLCRDQYPIEVGKLPNGDPDYLFPGLIVSNSETGSGALSLEYMMLRGICQNRQLWGVEGHKALRIRHTSGAPDRFLAEAVPQLEQIAQSATGAVVRKVIEAKATVIANDEDGRLAVLKNMELSKKAAQAVLDTVLREEGHPMASVWDLVQGVTAYARDIPHQDDRLALERKAGAMMNRIKI